MELDTLLADIRACRACAPYLPHEPRPVVTVKATTRLLADLPPPARCAALWRKDLIAALPEMELTLLLGRPAHLWALGKAAKPSMDAQVRAWRATLPSVLCLPHPSWRNTAWLKRNPWFEDEVTPYLRRRVAAMIGS
jgi:uracil-DNA glycosylase